MYESPFYLESPVSNNSFSYELRRLHSGGNPRLTVPALVDGTLADVAEGDDVVFEDFDDGALRSCRGLARFVRMRVPSTLAPVYVFDNHNHAFSFWAGEKLRGALSSPAVIVHVDQHRDTRVPGRMPSPDGLLTDEGIVRYANTELNVGNFIPAAIHAGLADHVVQIGSESDMDNFRKGQVDGMKLILDVDLDFFAPELDYIPNDKKISFIRGLLPQAAIVTIATSPFFIGQSRAISFLGRIFGEKKD